MLWNGDRFTLIASFILKFDTLIKRKTGSIIIFYVYLTTQIFDKYYSLFYVNSSPFI